MSSAMITSMMTHESTDYETQQRFSRALKTARSNSFGEKRCSAMALNRSNSGKLLQQAQVHPEDRKSPPSEQRPSFRKSAPPSISSNIGEEVVHSNRKSPPPPSSNSNSDPRMERGVSSSMSNSEKIRMMRMNHASTGYGGEVRNARKKCPPRAISLNEKKLRQMNASHLKTSDEDHPHHQAAPHFEYAGDGPSPMNRRVDACRRELQQPRQQPRRPVRGNIPRGLSLGSEPLHSSYHGASRASAAMNHHRQNMNNSYHGSALQQHQPRTTVQRRLTGEHVSDEMQHQPRTTVQRRLTGQHVSDEMHHHRDQPRRPAQRRLTAQHVSDEIHHHRPSAPAQRRLTTQRTSDEMYYEQQNRMSSSLRSFNYDWQNDEDYGMSEEKHEEDKRGYFDDRKMSVSEPERDANNMIEIFPGHSVPLRTTQETMAAVKRNAYQDAPCVVCGKELFCISDASYCICPSCKSISPLEDRGRAEGMRYGLGLGFTFDTLSRMQDEIMNRR